MRRVPGEEERPVRSWTTRFGRRCAAVLCVLGTLAGTAAAGPPRVGDPAPDFTLLDQDRNRVSLHDLRGSNVVLAFYVLAFTGG